MARISQLSKIGEFEKARVAIAKMIEESPLFRFLESASAFQEAATSDSWRPSNASATNLLNRDIDEGYAKKAIAIEAKQSTAHKFAGNAIKIDKSYLADADRNLLDIKKYLDERIDEEFYEYIVLLEKQLMLGTGAGDPAQLKGLIKILDGSTDLPGFTGEKGVINAEDYTSAAAAKSFDLTVDTYYDEFVEAMHLWLKMVPNSNALLMDPVLWARFTSIADERHALHEGLDGFGKPVRMFDGKPLIPLLDDSIAITEPDAADPAVDETTSLYIARLGENQCSVLTNSGLYWNEGDLLSADLTSNAVEWEFRGTWRFKKKKCIRRVRRIKVKAA